MAKTHKRRVRQFITDRTANDKSSRPNIARMMQHLQKAQEVFDRAHARIEPAVILAEQARVCAVDAAAFDLLVQTPASTDAAQRAQNEWADRVSAHNNAGLDYRAAAFTLDVAKALVKLARAKFPSTAGALQRQTEAAA